MTLQQIRYFVAVSQYLSFSRAAEQQYVSQTAVSQQIKLLEEELHTQLLARSTHTVRLTPAGQIFYTYAVKILDLTELAARKTRAAAQDIQPLTVSIMNGMENLPIVEQLLRFKEDHLNIPLHFQLESYDAIQQALLRRTADFGLMLEIMPLAQSGLRSVPVQTLQQYVVLNRQSRLAGYLTLRHAQLAGEQYYALPLAKELWARLSHKLAQQGLVTREALFVDSMQSLVLQIAFYGGYTILAEPVLAQLPANKNLTCIPLEGDTVPALALWNPENISPALRQLLDALSLET